MQRRSSPPKGVSPILQFRHAPPKAEWAQHTETILTG